MAGKRQYDEASRARVYATLLGNDGNVKRTARETGVPESTVRDMKREFELDPPKPEAIESAVGDFLNDAKRVRNKAVLEIERQIEAREMKGAALVTTVGVLDDKITRVEGVVARTQVDHVHHLPSAEEARALLGGLIGGAIEAQQQREVDLSEADVIEQAEFKALDP